MGQVNFVGLLQIEDFSLMGGPWLLVLESRGFGPSCLQCVDDEC